MLSSKHSRTSFSSKTSERAKGVGLNVHMDICGPVGTTTYDKESSFILFKDEYIAITALSN